MRKNSHGRILRGEPKEQYLIIVPKSYPYIYIYIYISLSLSLKVEVYHFFLITSSITSLFFPHFLK